MAPSTIRLGPADPALGTALFLSARLPPELATATTIEGLPIFKPPYSRVTAIDMNRGEHSWMAPLGNGPRNHPLLKNIALPPLGDGIQGGSVLITRTLLFVGVTRLSPFGGPAPPLWARWGDDDADRKAIYVFDKRSGDLLRVIDLDTSVAGAMTYMHHGRQFVVAAAGGGREAGLVALALPGAGPAAR